VQVQPLIAAEASPSTPCHKTAMAAMRSELLLALLPRRGDNAELSRALDRLVRRMATNRIIAGVQFPLDVLIGYALGTQVARALAALAGESKPPACWDDRRLPAANEQLTMQEDAERPHVVEGDFCLAPAPQWRTLWLRAVHEMSASDTDGVAQLEPR